MAKEAPQGFTQHRVEGFQPIARPLESPFALWAKKEKLLEIEDNQEETSAFEPRVS